MITTVRQRLIAAEARHVDLVTDGLPPRFCSSTVRRRLYALQAGEDVVVPGWLVGTALNIPLLHRATFYKLTGDDELTPVRSSPGASGGLPIVPPKPTPPPGLLTYLDRALGEHDDEDDDALAA